MDQVKIGKFISKKRKDIDLTQKQLAEKLGVSDKTVSKWETGDRMPDISLLQLLCQTLGIDVNELLSGEEIKNPQEYISKSNENLVDLVESLHKSKTQQIYFNIGVIVGVALVVVSFLGMVINLGGITQLPYYVDFKTAFFLAGIYILSLALSGSLKDYINAYLIAWRGENIDKKNILNAISVMKNSNIMLLVIGCLVSLCAIVSAFGWVNQVKYMGPALSQAVLAGLYTVIIEFLQVLCIQILNKYANS